MKGIILAGGEGTRLAPFTNITNKSLFPINKKFVIDYPLNTLKEIGVRDLMVVLGGSHFSQIVSYIKDGRELGFDSVQYCYQGKALGIAHAINLCKSFCWGGYEDQFVCILGDNVYENPIKWSFKKKANIGLYATSELNRFGVASIVDDKIIKIEEKPKVIDNNLTNLAITGIYGFDIKFFDFFKNLKPSARGEFEIVDIIKQYLAIGQLDYSILSGLWSDAGTFESAKFVADYFLNKEKSAHT